MNWCWRRCNRFVDVMNREGGWLVGIVAKPFDGFQEAKQPSSIQASSKRAFSNPDSACAGYSLVDNAEESPPCFLLGRPLPACKFFPILRRHHICSLRLAQNETEQTFYLMPK